MTVSHGDEVKTRITPVQSGNNSLTHFKLTAEDSAGGRTGVQRKEET